jgi:type I restriction enzyme S subunit
MKQEFVPIAVPPKLQTAPNDWVWRKLNEVARLESGHTPSRLRGDWWGGDVSWLSLTEIRSFDGKWVNETKIKTNEKGIANSAARILPRGTVCFSRTASVGFVAIMGKPMATSQDFANWVCSDQVDSDFLMLALIRSRNELRSLATGATHKTIYMPTLEAFHICLPEPPVQRRIVADLQQQLAVVEGARAAAQTQLEEIEHLPGRLMARAF